MSKAKIPIEIQEKANRIIAEYNKTTYRNKKGVEYFARCKGEFLYLDRMEEGEAGPICRLRYTGDFEKWGFAIYKFSIDRYDEDEWMFPGSRHVNGTILGALKAGNDAYPPSWSPFTDKDFNSIFGQLFGNKKK